MREKFFRFMQGRYGLDQFSRFLLIVGLIIVLISNFFGGLVLNLIGWLVIVYTYFRIFSRNHPRRYRENDRYLNYVGGIKKFFHRSNRARKDRSTHRIFQCPSCKQKIRIPRGKGRIEIRCPKCSTRFIKRS